MLNILESFFSHSSLHMDLLGVELSSLLPSVDSIQH